MRKETLQIVRETSVLYSSDILRGNNANRIMIAYALSLVLSFVLFLQSQPAPNARSQKQPSIKERVEKAYGQVKQCLQLSSTLSLQTVSYTEDLEEHYREILAVTGQFRGIVPHRGSGNFSGMSSRCNEVLSTLHPIRPSPLYCVWSP